MAGPLYYDRVKETTSTTGTGTYTLAGAVTGFQAFSVVGNSNTCFYAATDGTNWEVGLGTYTLSGTTLARTTILASSNSNAAVSWSAGSKTIWLDVPAATVGTTLGTVQATTSGTAINFTGIPSWVREITLMWELVSTNGSSPPQIQIGDTTNGYETTGYTNDNAVTINSNIVGSASFTTGFGVGEASGNWASSITASGQFILSLMDPATNKWTISGSVSRTGATTGVFTTAGSKALGGVLDRLRVTTVNGTDTFDGGNMNIAYRG